MNVVERYLRKTGCAFSFSGGYVTCPSSIIVNLLKMEWVDINIKKPEVGEKVWTYFSHFDEVGIGTFSHPEPNRAIPGVENMDCFDFEDLGWLCDDITLWMPKSDVRPEVPK